MCSVVVLLMLVRSPVAPKPDPVMTLRARAALALAFTPPTYAEQYVKAEREKKPLVVFVGRPVEHVGGCVCVSSATFPNANRGDVVIGVPDGGTIRRKDLSDTPSLKQIREAVRTAQVERTAAPLPRQ